MILHVPDQRRTVVPNSRSYNLMWLLFSADTGHVNQISVKPVLFDVIPTDLEKADGIPRTRLSTVTVEAMDRENTEAYSSDRLEI